MKNICNAIIIAIILGQPISIMSTLWYESSTTAFPEMNYRNTIIGQMINHEDDKGKTDEKGGDKAENEKDKGDGEDKGIDNGGWDRIFDAPKLG